MLKYFTFTGTANNSYMVKVVLAVRNINDRKTLFAKGSRKSEEFKHFKWFLFIFLTACNEQSLF